jgi:hypothetical protein
MKKFRFQFSLRTLFIFSFLVAIVCALIKCKKDAESNFIATTHVVYESLKKIDKEVDEDLYKNWLEEAKGNPTFPDFIKHHPTKKDRIPVVIQTKRSSADCIGLADIFFIRKRVLSPKINFSQTILEKDVPNNDVIAVNFAITGPRYYGILSQKSSLSISYPQLPQNDLLISRLKTAFDKAGLTYNLMDIKREDWYRH